MIKIGTFPTWMVLKSFYVDGGGWGILPTLLFPTTPADTPSQACRFIVSILIALKHFTSPTSQATFTESNYLHVSRNVKRNVHTGSLFARTAILWNRFPCGGFAITILTISHQRSVIFLPLATIFTSYTFLSYPSFGDTLREVALEPCIE